MEVIVLLDGSGPLLDLLRRRYGGDEIYTFTGNILISINPYRFIPGLYAIPAAGDGNVIAYSRDHIPHVFTIAELSYDTMMRQVGPVGNRDTHRSLRPPPPPPPRVPFRGRGCHRVVVVPPATSPCRSHAVFVCRCDRLHFLVTLLHAGGPCP
jgi:hypothetical protein